MIIKGKFKTFGFWFSISAVIGGLAILIGISIKGFGSAPVAAQVFLLTVVFMLISLYGKLLYDANSIKINTEAKTISFKNLFTGVKTVYNFSDFDGKLVCYKPIKGGWAKFIYLVKNKKVVKKINDFIYSNEKELLLM